MVWAVMRDQCILHSSGRTSKPLPTPDLANVEILPQLLDSEIQFVYHSFAFDNCESSCFDTSDSQRSSRSLR